MTGDLAALARDNHRGLPPLEATMRAVLPAPRTAEHEMLALSRLYAARLSRIGCSLAALAYSAIVLFVLWNPLRWTPWVDGEEPPSLLDLSGTEALVRLVLVVAAAHVISRALANRAFDRALTRGREDARTLVEDIDRRALALAIVGATMVSLTVAMALFVCGLESWLPLIYPYDGTQLVTASVVHVVVLLVPCLAGAMLVAWRPRVARGFEHRLVIPLAAAAVVATLCVGFSYDEGSLSTTNVPWETSESLRFALTIAGGVALFCLASGILVRLHRRERAS